MQELQLVSKWSLLFFLSLLGWHIVNTFWLRYYLYWFIISKVTVTMSMGRKILRQPYMDVSCFILRDFQYLSESNGARVYDKMSWNAFRCMIYDWKYCVLMYTHIFFYYFRFWYDSKIQGFMGSWFFLGGCGGKLKCNLTICRKQGHDSFWEF